MGNAALKTTCSDVRLKIDDGGTKSCKSQKRVTVMKWDGTVMEFDREFSVCKLLKDFPGHCVCKAEDLGSIGKAKMLSPKTLLVRGKSYFVLPRAQHQKQKRKVGTKRSKVNPVLCSLGHVQDSEPQEKCEEVEEVSAPARIRIVMTKQQLEKMIADGSIVIDGSQAAHDLTNMERNVPGLWCSSMRLFNHPRAGQINSTSFKRNWSPELDSIVEVPDQ